MLDWNERGDVQEEERRLSRGRGPPRGPTPGSHDGFLRGKHQERYIRSKGPFMSRFLRRWGAAW